MITDSPGSLRPSWSRRLVFALLSLVVAPPAVADAGAAPRFVDPSMAWLGTAVPGPPGAWRVAAADAVAETLCRSGKPLAGWLGLAPMAPPAVGDCRPARSLRAVTQVIGRQVGVFVTAPGGSALRLEADTLHRAIAPGPGGGAGTWRSIDPRLPDVPIAVLLPESGTPSWQLLSAVVLQVGCLGKPVIRRIFDAGERRARCETVRTDGAVDRHRQGTDIAGWLSARGAGAVAFVTYPEFLALGEGGEPVAFADTLPTLAAVAADRYAVTRSVHLALALAEPADPALLRQMLRVVGEETIGPGGTFAGLGIVPLPAAARVQLRQTLLALGGAI